MAAHSSNFIRVRLHFDYPPPAVVDCRMCWLLVDLNSCRVVADVESVIREKFEFSRSSILSLFIEDCYLPHIESVLLLRDNDCVRVKVDCLSQVNGHSSCPDTASENCRKRQRATEEDGPGENGVSVGWKKKKRKKRSEESLERDAKQASADERKQKKSEGKRTEKKNKKKETTVTPKPAASTKTPPASVEQPVKSSKKPPVKTQNVSSSDSSSSSSSSEEDTALKKPAAKKPAAPKPAAKTPSSTPAASKTPLTTKPPQAKSHPPPSSSSESISSSDEATAVKTNRLTFTTPKGGIIDNCLPAPQPTGDAQKQAVSAAPPPHGKTAASSDSDSEDEIKLVIRRPLQQQPGLGLGSSSSWRGRGRGQSRRGGPGEKERGGGGGRGGGGFRGHGSEFSYNGAKEPSCLTDSLTNVSVVLQNGAGGGPKPDYSSMPLLAAPPQVGQRIVFKLLELTENYTPEVSEYKEGKIVSFDPTTKQIELEVLHTSQAPVEPGKFDLVYQNPDGSESVEYAVSRGSQQVTERWDSLLEPRLII